MYESKQPFFVWLPNNARSLLRHGLHNPQANEIRTIAEFTLLVNSHVKVEKMLACHYAFLVIPQFLPHTQPDLAPWQKLHLTQLPIHQATSLAIHLTV